MRIVLDTNVLVAGLLSPHGPPAAILQLVLSGRTAVCFDARILSEYREVLARPRFGFDAAHTDVVLEFIEGEGELVSAVPLDLSLPDPSDGMFIEVGVTAAVDHLVTGNLRHFPARRRHGLSVVSPRAFVDRVLAE